MTIDPTRTDPVNVYKVMIGSIIPRPIAFVSTMSPEGILNLAPFSFFTGASANPPVVCFSPMHSAEGMRKDTIHNIERRGEFVVNIVSEEFVEKMNITGRGIPPEVDEFAAAGLTPLASDMIAVPRVKESHVGMECRLLQIVDSAGSLWAAASSSAKWRFFTLTTRISTTTGSTPTKWPRWDAWRATRTSAVRIDSTCPGRPARPRAFWAIEPREPRARQTRSGSW